MQTTKKVQILIIALLAGFGAWAQPAQVQVIHNSGDFALEILDVYAGDSLIADSLPYREATAYVDVPAGGPAVFAIQSPSFPDTAAPLSRDTFNFTAGSSYVLIITGLISSAPYDSLKPLELAMHETRTSSRQLSNTDMLVYNGVVDSPPITIEDSTAPNPLVVDSLRYGRFSGYEEFPSGDYEFTVFNAPISEIIAEYQAPWQSLGFEDSALVVLVSGFHDTLKKEEGDTNFLRAPKFQLFYALPSGGPLQPLPIISDIGIDEVVAGRLEFYPNPARDKVFLRSEEQLEAEEVIFYNVNGKVVQRAGLDHSNGRSHIDVSNLDKGIYFLKLRDGWGTSYPVYKIMID